MVRRKDFLSPFEWEILNVIWDKKDEATVKEIWEFLYPEKEKAYTTVQTIMNILVEKRFLKKKKIGPVNLYSPITKRENAVSKEAGIFLEKVFNGSFQKMVNFMVGQGKLSKEDLEELKKMIEKKEKDGR
ncbi:BlaI/MecI/CopY family transcriptional regulator [candidate division KSB1 bacterium]